MSLAALWKYVTSYTDGRVRLRHPGLMREDVCALIQQRFSGIDGVSGVETNPRTGSMLVTYDPEKFTTDDLIAHGTKWGAWLDALHSGQNLPAPE